MTVTLSHEEEALVERLAQAIVKRRLSVPAILLLESGKPLAFVGGQFLRLLEPGLRALVDRPEYGTFAGLVEDRDKVEALLQRIEALQAEADGGRKQP